MPPNNQLNQIPKQPDNFRRPPEKKRWPLSKVLASLLVTLLVFSGGVIVGRSKLHIPVLDSFKSNKVASSQLNYSSLDQIYELLRADFDGNLDKNKLIDGARSGLVAATGDPYTEYFNSKDAKAFNDALSGSFTGIGAELGTDKENHIVIVSPLAGYPAEKAGLKPKDIVAAVDGQSTDGMSISAVVRKIRGTAGTSVKLTIVRGSDKPMELNITRVQVTIPSVESKIDGQIGYLKISQFTNDTVGLAKKAAQDFKVKGVKAVVLDLRGNPGGYLQGAVDISSLWLDSGKTVVSERRGTTVISTEAANGGNTLKGLLTVVLINGGSASASEITAGALHDNSVATLIGTKSFGKGSVQQVENLADGSELKVTIAHWYTPKGINIDKQGITPDTTVDVSDADAAAGKDPQKDNAYQLLKTKIQ